MLRQIPDAHGVVHRGAGKRVSMMPTGLVANLTPEELADLLAHLQSL
jgi:hypothetical protein